MPALAVHTIRAHPGLPFYARGVCTADRCNGITLDEWSISRNLQGTTICRHFDVEDVSGDQIHDEWLMLSARVYLWLFDIRGAERVFEL